MLTIISVSYKSKDLLKRNYELLKKLNPDTPFKWIVVQNTPEKDLDADLSMDDPNFIMIKGPSLTQQESESSYYRSIHHGKALNLGVSSTDADLILTLDPDCFILMPNWIECVAQHMQRQRLHFFGVPYHPRYYTHYRGFPNAICMFINRRLMQDKNCFSLDFSPLLGKKPSWLKALSDGFIRYSHRAKIIEFFSFFKKKLLQPKNVVHLKINRVVELMIYLFLTSKLWQFLDKELLRFKVGSCFDTGYRIYHSYRSHLRHQIFELFADDQRSCWVKFLESMLPDRNRFFPRNNAFIRKTPSPLFIEFGENGEQFFWNDQLFAFHLKGVADTVSEEAKIQLKRRVEEKIDKYLDEIQNTQRYAQVNSKPDFI